MQAWLLLLLEVVKLLCHYAWLNELNEQMNLQMIFIVVPLKVSIIIPGECNQKV